MLLVTWEYVLVGHTMPRQKWQYQMFGSSVGKENCTPTMLLVTWKCVLVGHTMPKMIQSKYVRLWNSPYYTHSKQVTIHKVSMFVYVFMVDIENNTTVFPEDHCQCLVSNSFDELIQTARTDTHTHPHTHGKDLWNHNVWQVHKKSCVRS